MYLSLVLAALICIYNKVAIAYEQHCIDPANCQFYPIHSCFATDNGLVCKNRNKGGFEISIDPLYTFTFSPINVKNDTGLPCRTIPITDELYNYVDFRGPDVIDFGDLDLIGNCSKMSYCDAKTKTCQPKLPLGSQCQYNMQCYFGIDGIPGHCTNNTCAIREDIPQYYYNSPRWSMGDQWKPAIIAVVITGAIAAVLIIGRIQVKKMINYLKGALERWQNADSRPVSYAVNEQVWNEHHDQQRRWWKQVPGVNWVYQKLNRGEREQYYQLDSRSEEPPPYRAD